MDATQVLDAVLHRRGQVVIGGARVDEPGVAACARRRRFDAQQGGPLGRHRMERAVGVEAFRALGQAVLPARVVRNDVPVPVQVAGAEQLGRHAAGDVGHPSRPAGDLQRSERAAEADLLLVGDVRVPHHQHAEPRHPLLDDVDQVPRRLPSKVRAHQLPGEDRVKGVQDHGSPSPVTRRPPQLVGANNSWPFRRL